MLLKPSYLFFSDSGGFGKSCLINLLTNQFRKCSSIKTAHQINHVLLLTPTVVLSNNINGTTMHSTLGIPSRGRLYTFYIRYTVL